MAIFSLVSQRMKKALEYIATNYAYDEYSAAILSDIAKDALRPLKSPPTKQEQQHD